jgi:hypothetical protein
MVGFGCADAALAAVYEWVFSPATLAGAPVETTTTVSVPFNIE